MESYKKDKKAEKFTLDIRREDETWASTKIEKAKGFAEHFSKVFEPYPRGILEEEENCALTDNTSEPPDNSQIVNVRTSEVKKIIKKLKKRKTQGYDNIGGKNFKKL